VFSLGFRVISNDNKGGEMYRLLELHTGGIWSLVSLSKEVEQNEFDSAVAARETAKKYAGEVIKAKATSPSNPDLPFAIKVEEVGWKWTFFITL